MDPCATFLGDLAHPPLIAIVFRCHLVQTYQMRLMGGLERVSVTSRRLGLYWQ
jgi:hypothetical protein